jgi:hypothetical protein
MTGSLTVDETATFAGVGDQLPDGLDAHVSGEVLAFGNGADGNYDVDLLLCARDVVASLQGHGTDRTGWEGTVGSADASDSTPGFDPTCAPSPP